MRHRVEHSDRTLLDTSAGQSVYATTEYHRSQKLQDMLSKRIIYEVLVLKTSTKGNALIDKYNEQG